MTQASLGRVTVASIERLIGARLHLDDVQGQTLHSPKVSNPSSTAALAHPAPEPSPSRYN
jgi:hypothetical protein